MKSLRRSGSPGLIHTGLFVRHLPCNESLAVFLNDVVVLDPKSLGKYNCFIATVDPWDLACGRKALFMQVGLDAINNNGVADLYRGTREPNKSVSSEGLGRKNYSTDPLSNLVALSRYILPLSVSDLLETVFALMEARCR